MEALGQPAASQPPAPVTPRIDVPPRPLAPVQPPIPQLIPSWKLTPEERRKRPYILKKTPVPGSVTPAEQISTPPIARALEVHEAQLSKKLPTIKTPMQAYAAATRSFCRNFSARREVCTFWIYCSRRTVGDTAGCGSRNCRVRTAKPLELTARFEKIKALLGHRRHQKSFLMTN